MIKVDKTYRASRGSLDAKVVHGWKGNPVQQVSVLVRRSTTHGDSVAEGWFGQYTWEILNDLTQVQYCTRHAHHFRTVDVLNAQRRFRSAMKGIGTHGDLF